jgi:hypothetical protein
MHVELVDLDVWCSQSIMRKSYEMIQQHQISRNIRAHYRVHNKRMTTTHIDRLSLLVMEDTPVSETTVSEAFSASSAFLQRMNRDHNIYQPSMDDIPIGGSVVCRS